LKISWMSQHRNAVLSRVRRSIDGMGYPEGKT
jgi:hypothetical protein